MKPVKALDLSKFAFCVYCNTETHNVIISLGFIHLEVDMKSALRNWYLG